MNKLLIAQDLVLPLEAVTEKLAFLGRTGSGKTYAAMKLAELMMDAGAQIVALDPVGAWHGLRIGGNFNIYIFGGLRGDFPLEPTGGTLMADIVSDRGISVVIDVSQFIRSEQIRFANDFVTRLFNKKKAHPSAMHLFIEECQEFIPQNVNGEEAKMLHNFERAWKIGRNFGIGGSLISQRPQEINKKALNQAGTLFVFNMTGPQERKAIADWTRQAGIDEDIESVLPTLKTGNPHVWSPTFLSVSKTVHILPKITADVSMTPKVGARVREQPLTSLDVTNLKEQMAATVERAKADDPKELRKQILSLKQEILSLKQVQPQTQRVEVSVLTDEDRVYFQQFANLIGQFRHEMDRFDSKWAPVQAVLEKVAKVQPAPLSKPSYKITEKRQGPRQPQRSRPVAHSSQPERLTNPEQRILDAIAWMESIGVQTPEQTAVAFLAGYTIGGGGFNNPRGALRTKGLVEYVGDRIQLTPEGRGLANTPKDVLTTEELHRAVMERLPNPEQKLLSVILKHYPKSISNEQCAAEAGYTAGSGGYNNPRGRLRTLGLIEYPGGGAVRARDILFI